ncbi:hypothetical protein EIP86_009537 [Pleurotus ostreatoroseus]|nr:hypothetical protein EIP86_009537 [Pleurotus ostreatoroseus]
MNYLGDPTQNNWAFASSSSLHPSHPSSAGGSPNPSGDPTQSGWPVAPPHPSPGAESSFRQLDKSPSSMLSAVPMYYDPEEVPSQSGVDYAQWVQANYPEQYGYLDGSQTSPMGSLGYGQAGGQAQHQVPNVPNPQMPTPPMQNHYQFVQSPYSAAASNQPDTFHDPTTSNVAARVSHPPMGYPARQQGQRQAVTSISGYAQSQNQPQFASTSYIQQPAQSTYAQDAQGNYVQVQQTYFSSNQADTSSTLMAPSQGEFTFSYPNNSSETLPVSAGSTTSYTPSSEHVNLSVSPRSWMGADDGLQPGVPHATPPAATAGPSRAPPPSKQDRPNSPKRAKNNKRVRPNPPDEVESGTDDDESQPAVPPLRGPEANPTRLCVIYIFSRTIRP